MREDKLAQVLELVDEYEAASAVDFKVLPSTKASTTQSSHCCFLPEKKSVKRVYNREHFLTAMRNWVEEHEIEQPEVLELVPPRRPRPEVKNVPKFTWKSDWEFREASALVKRRHELELPVRTQKRHAELSDNFYLVRRGMKLRAQAAMNKVEATTAEDQEALLQSRTLMNRLLKGETERKKGLARRYQALKRDPRSLGLDAQAVEVLRLAERERVTSRRRAILQEKRRDDMLCLPTKSLSRQRHHYDQEQRAKFWLIHLRLAQYFYYYNKCSKS